MTLDLTEYDRSMAPARTRFAAGRWLSRMLAPATPADALERFVIEVASRGVSMVEPTEDWIESAGVQCVLTGLPELGRALRRRAAQERGRHMSMIADTHALVARRRKGGRPCHPAGLLLGRPVTPAVRRYVRVHEDVIGGSAPCAEIAVLYEIERMWAVHGLALVARCRETLGRDVVSCLGFIEERVATYGNAARFSATELNRLLAAHPELQTPLVNAASAALLAHAGFFEECVDTTAISGDRWTAVPSPPQPLARVAERR